jgi:AraC-like DNA-binding protein
MKLSYSSLKDEDVFTLTDFQCSPAQKILDRNGLYKILWNRAESVELRIDDYRAPLRKNEVVFCTPLNLIEVPQDNEGIVAFVFNKQFFCIQTHDDQVSCQGFLFFGSAQPQFIQLSNDDLSHFELMHQLFLKDLNYKDHLQGEMLRSLLKRLLITSTRLLREDMPDPSIKQTQLDLIREFNILVEKHFKDYHKVKEYANLLHKSPKTLSNLFTKHINKSPLNVINERIMLEAKRLLLYSDLSNDEISSELGYKEASHFSKFFKKHSGVSPKLFKKSKMEPVL